MALDGTYAGLLASIAGFLNRADLTAVIPDFVILAEAQMQRRFVGRQQQGLPIPRHLIGRSDATFALAAEYIAVPTDFFGPLQLLLTASDASMIELDYLDDANFQNLKVNGYYPGYPITQPQTGAPKYYTVVGGEIQILPVADQAYTGEMTYIKRTPAASTATNWILTSYPDAYLYGALVQSAPYLRDDGRIAIWGTLFTAALDDICNADPMPTDKSTLRSEIALIQTFSRPGGRYNINTDSI